jgi:hypothetical protein
MTFDDQPADLGAHLAVDHTVKFDARGGTCTRSGAGYATDEVDRREFSGTRRATLSERNGMVTIRGSPARIARYRMGPDRLLAVLTGLNDDPRRV